MERKVDKFLFYLSALALIATTAMAYSANKLIWTLGFLVLGIKLFKTRMFYTLFYAANVIVSLYGYIQFEDSKLLMLTIIFVVGFIGSLSRLSHKEQKLATTPKPMVDTTTAPVVATRKKAPKKAKKKTTRKKAAKKKTKKVRKKSRKKTTKKKARKKTRKKAAKKRRR